MVGWDIFVPQGRAVGRAGSSEHHHAAMPHCPGYNHSLCIIMHKTCIIINDTTF